MDSLLASYASSDEEEDNHSSPSLPPQKPSPIPIPTPKPSSSLSLLFSLPPPKSSLPNLPPPPNPSILHQHHHGKDDDEEDEEPESNPPQFPRPKSFIHQPPPNPSSAPTKPTSFFSSLPPPKSNPNPDPNPTPTFSSAVPPPKRVVQFQPPINPNFAAHKGEDDNDKKSKKPDKMGSQSSSIGTSSVMSFLSNIPAPKNSKAALGGALPSSGSGRRSVVEADFPVTVSGSNEVKSDNEVSRASIDTDFGNHESNWTDVTSPVVVSGSEGGVVGAASMEGDYSSWVRGNQNYDHYDSYGSYGGSESNWANGSSTMALAPESDVLGMIESAVKVPGKRGRNEIPTTIVEVQQDELIKNRPREDQSKLTGVAFGPSYQPVSAKGKPSKLHKRKHQIGSLFFDMKQKETELAERRSRGFLTKAETQAKYGW